MTLCCTSGLQSFCHAVGSLRTEANVAHCYVVAAMADLIYQLPKRLRRPRLPPSVL